MPLIEYTYIKFVTKRKERRSPSTYKNDQRDDAESIKPCQFVKGDFFFKVLRYRSEI